MEIKRVFSKLTSSALGLSFGSKASIRSNKLSARGSAFGNFCVNGVAFFRLIVLK
jgi:hypothetical protein